MRGMFHDSFKLVLGVLASYFGMIQFSKRLGAEGTKTIFFPGEGGKWGLGTGETWDIFTSEEGKRDPWNFFSVPRGRRVFFGFFFTPSPISKLFLKLSTFRSKWASFSFALSLSVLDSSAPLPPPSAIKSAMKSERHLSHYSRANNFSSRQNRGLIGWERGGTTIFKALF